MKIQHVTNKDSIGILSCVENLTRQLNDSGVDVDIKNWKNINYFTKYDISHFHVSNSTRAILLTLPFFRSRFKVITVHDIIPRNKKIPIFAIKLMYIYMNVFANHFIVHSKFAKKLLLETAPFIHSNKIVVIPLGCNIVNHINTNALRYKYGYSMDSTIFSMVGYIKKSKGQIDVIEAFEKINHSSIKLLVIGKILDEESKNKIENLNCDTVEYLGFLDDQKLFDYMELSDCLISYRFESVGESSGPMLIAIGMAKPILCSNCGSFPEIVENSGIVVNNLFDLKEAITKLSDRNVRSKIIEFAKTHRDKYSWKSVSLEHMNLYDKMGRN
ncbi:Glycosyltransferase [Methanosarcina siciliae C2J]|uniref:Glycosyltransferase n=1 Tax=Methanosarcina siciliae C2J TaxID=1434118 RepID=A0A0E3PTF6_9EURY|nr:glycosyltransferase family 4 protein [Methanosarcina siciliae]AKB38788.1 Glycosyltransferase [Methanosarcina siciliae C2J]